MSLYRRSIHAAAVFLLTVCFLLVVTAANGETPGLRKFAGGFSFGRYPVHQNNVSTVFDVAGYRLVNADFDQSYTSSAVSPNAPVSVSYPGTSLLLDYCPEGRLGLRIELLWSSTATRNYANINHADTVNDRLSLKINSTSSNLMAFYRILPYKARKKVGLELTTSAGIAFCSLSERIDVRYPLSDTTGEAMSVSQQSHLNHSGVSALFGFDALIRIGQRFSFMPARILWGLSVLYPSFDELRFESGSNRRVLPARNYDLSGLYWQIGAFYHF
ncbi:MAG: hypothetical protein RL021_1449 [Bacteroidota bacterium]